MIARWILAARFALGALSALAAAACSPATPDGDDASERASGPGESLGLAERLGSIGPGTIGSLVDAPYGLRATVQTNAVGAGGRGSATIVLPAVATSWTRVTDDASGAWCAFRLRGAADAPLTVEGRLAVYDSAAPGGGIVVLRPLTNGVEDFVGIDVPRPAGVAYELDVSGVAGLRAVGGAVELLDANGAPRLRVARPYLVDAVGARHEASLAVEGCAVSDDPAPPFGRTPRPPGARACVLRAIWDDARVRHPAVLDPLWTTTADMAEGRTDHAAETLPDGRVLVFGGWDADTSTALSTAELYDPTSQAWAATGALAGPRHRHRAAPTGSGALAIGGGTQDVERYDAASGTWSTIGTMPAFLTSHTATALSDGRVLVAGGFAFATEAYVVDPTSGSVATVGSLAVGRREHTATLLGDGRVLVAGGTNTATTFSSVEIYDPSSTTFAAGPALSVRRRAHLAAPVAGGVLVVGGFGSVGFERSAERYDGGSWVPAGVPSRAWTSQGTSTALPGGRVLFAGGNDLAEVFDAAAASWGPAGTPLAIRSSATASPLTGGAVLLAGGVVGGGSSRTAEVFRLGADGTSCGAASECASGFCADGVCCGTDCSAPCVSCRAADRDQGVDGECGPVRAGLDVGDCVASAASACGPDGACDGAGACRLHPSGTECSPAICNDDVERTPAGSCDGAGTCIKPPAQTCAPFACASGACATSCVGDAGCGGAFHCAAPACLPDRPIGAACDRPAQCMSGSCADAVCCDRACTGTCEACSATAKGGPPDGTCGRAAAGTTCGPVSCASLSVQRDPDVCDATGACVAGGTTPCAPGYACGGSGCNLMCGSDVDCFGAAHCASGVCELDQPNGAGCSEDQRCQSGHCVDGYCCESACDGICSFCGFPWSPGQCVAVTGTPRGARPPCAGVGTACGGECDGTDAAACAYPDDTVACGPGLCDGDVASADRCDGTGACVRGEREPCFPYRCTDGTCLRPCTRDADCALGFACADGSCTPATGQCLDETTFEDPKGQRTLCAPYLCASGACRTDCTATADCARGFVCDPTQRTCVEEAGGEVHDDGGCGCRVARGTRAPPWSVLAGAVGLAPLLRRVPRPGSRRAQRTSTA